MLRRLAAGLATFAAVLVAWQWLMWPEVAELAERDPETTAFIERHRRASGRPPEHTWVAYDRISPELKHAVLVAEDIGFFDHRGFELEEVRAAVRQAIDRKKAPRGASTLTQQLAKNLWLSPSRNPWRKVKEVLLTRQLERHLTKRRILELYLNVVQFGPDVFGAEAAARRYFNASAGSLSERQAARLAAGLSRPRSWNPATSAPGYNHRVELLRTRMRRSRWILKEL